MYHYDPATGSIPPGFPSAINLSVKCVAAAQAQAQAQAQMKSSEPTSPGGSVMDLSTSSVTSTSPQVRTLCSPSSLVCFSLFSHFLLFHSLRIWQCNSFYRHFPWYKYFAHFGTSINWKLGFNLGNRHKPSRIISLYTHKIHLIRTITATHTYAYMQFIFN